MIDVRSTFYCLRRAQNSTGNAEKAASAFLETDRAAKGFFGTLQKIHRRHAERSGKEEHSKADADAETDSRPNQSWLAAIDLATRN